MTARPPPASLEAERAVLGSVLIKPTAVTELLATAVADDFLLPAHREMYEAMAALDRRGVPIDPVVLGDELRVRGALPRLEGGAGYIMRLAEETPTAENIDHYLRVVREKATLRRLITTCSEIATQAYGEYGEFETFLDEAERSVFKVTMQTRSSNALPASASMGPLLDEFERRQREQRLVTGVPTGLRRFDEYTHGLQPEHLIVVAGRPGMGKTALALNVVANAAIHHRIPCLVLSLEMSTPELLERLVVGESRIDGTDLKAGHVAYTDYKLRLLPATLSITRAPIVIDDTGGQSILQIAATARRFRANPAYFPPDPPAPPGEPAEAKRPPLGLVLVDYLQLARGSGAVKGQSREQEVSEITRGLKVLAKDIKLPVIAVSQLNRDLEKRTDKRPQLSDLRESGSIEQDADEIVFIHRDDYYGDGPDVVPGKAEISIKKNRHGSTGTIFASWLRQFTRFENYAAPGGDPDDDGG